MSQEQAPGAAEDAANTSQTPPVNPKFVGKYRFLQEHQQLHAQGYVEQQDYVAPTHGGHFIDEDAYQEEGSSEAPEQDEEQQDWQPDEADQEAAEEEDGAEAGEPSEDDSGDSDYGGGRRSKRPAARRPAAKAKPVRRPQPARRRGRSADTDDDAEQDEDDDETMAAALAADDGWGRPRRQAARKASAAMKAQCDEDDDLGSSRSRRRARYASADEDGFEDGEEEEEAYDEDDEDEAYARALNEELNGLRRRPRSTRGAPPVSSGRSTRSAAVGRRSSGRQSGGSSRTGSLKRKAPPRSTRNVKAINYAESDSGSDAEYERQKKAKREALPALEDWPGEDEEGGIERILGHQEDPEVPADPGNPWASRKLHIKWQRQSYLHCSWEPLSALEGLPGYKRVANYIKRMDALAALRPQLSPEEQETLDLQAAMEEEMVAQYVQVERIITSRPDADCCYLVKWEGLPYAEATWENSTDVSEAPGGLAAIDLYNQRQQRLLEAGKPVDAQRAALNRKRARAELNKIEEQPQFLTGGQLRDYQLVGLNWMYKSWLADVNGILADEMGLGKTVQCVSWLSYMAEAIQVRGPFLVVVPLSTVPNWLREFKKWAPQLSVVVYVGDSRSREVIRQHEFRVGAGEAAAKSRDWRFEVIITTYELVMKDANVLSKVKWNYMMVDEAHRLKNSESALYQELCSWQFKNKLLITGTPLQNSMKELWALLHFLDPAKFPDQEHFEQVHSLSDADGLARLHHTLGPHLLRRVIKDVEKSLPPKNERILRVEMSPLQRQYYKWILTRNYAELNKGTRGGGRASLLNIIGELKKCCNHPFLFESAEDNYRGSEDDKSAVERLTVTSGKMVLLDKLLRRLKDTGHRVLLFSQMVRVLDIISDYMRMRGYQHQRLDGSTPAAARHQAMEHFNAPDSHDFAFLLSTRAGGLGINLATADTVIIFDSDWNPQNDLQAMSRAHRIGQKDTVNIYRFVTSGSVEEDILERAKRKMVLDHLVIQRMDASGRTTMEGNAGGKQSKELFQKEELAAILRFGAEELFKEEGDAEKQKALYEEDIDAILERAEVVDTRTTTDSGVANELLAQFNNVAYFKNEEDDTTFWNRLISPEDRATLEQEQRTELLPRAARLKPEERAALGLGPDADSDGEDDEGGGRKGGAGGQGKKRPRARAAVKRDAAGGEPGPPVDGAALRVDEWLLDVGSDGRPLRDEATTPPDAEPTHVRTISRRDATAFVRGVRRWGVSAGLDKVATEVGPLLEEATPAARLSLWHSLMDGCRRAVDITVGEQQDAKDAMLDFFGTAVKAQELLNHCSALKLLAKRVEALTAAGQDPARSFRLDPGSIPPAVKWGKQLNWTTKDDAMLLLGVHYHGLGRWEAIIKDPRLGLSEVLAGVLAKPEPKEGGVAAAAAAAAAAGGSTEGTPAPAAADKDKDVGPKGSHLETRVLAILRKMQASSKAVAHAKQAVAAAVGGRKGLAEAADKAQPLGKARPPRPAAPKRKAPAAGGGGTPGTDGKEGGAAAAAAEPTKRQRMDPAEGGKGPAAAAAAADSGNGRPSKTAKLSRQEKQDMLRGVLSDLNAWKHLQKEDNEGQLEAKEVVKRTRTYLLSIGQHIDKQPEAAAAAAKKQLWHYIAKYVGMGETSEEAAQNGEKLQAMYLKFHKKQQQQQEAAHGAEAGKAHAAAGGARPSVSPAPAAGGGAHKGSTPPKGGSSHAAQHHNTHRSPGQQQQQQQQQQRHHTHTHTSSSSRPQQSPYDGRHDRDRRDLHPERLDGDRSQHQQHQQHQQQHNHGGQDAGGAAAGGSRSSRWDNAEPHAEHHQQPRHQAGGGSSSRWGPVAPGCTTPSAGVSPAGPRPMVLSGSRTPPAAHQQQQQRPSSTPPALALPPQGSGGGAGASAELPPAPPPPPPPPPPGA